MQPVVAALLKENNLLHCDYAEPYAGGCGLALSLLLGGYVSDIHINDIDKSIWSFWNSVLDQTDELAALISETPINLAEWHKQKDIVDNPNNYSTLELGFAAFFLNRTNRSGIIKNAGVIGGFSQKGQYKIDCRFNRDGLVRRIRRIGKYKSRIHLSNLDAIEFVKLPDFKGQTFFCIDPPYFNKGASLYTSFYDPNDHAVVAETILKLSQPWIVTYDDASEIRQLYKPRRKFHFDINYSVQTKRIGTELLITSKGLRIPANLREREIKKAA